MADTQTVVRVTKEKEFEVASAPLDAPGRKQVRVKVLANGVCHSDVFVKEGLWPDLELPRVPGHEVIGRVDAVGEGVGDLSPGDFVGIGWHGGHCFTCERCRAGDFALCENSRVCGISYDGGYAEYVTAPWSALARVPEGMDPVTAAPLLCAGVTTYNALRHGGARPGDLVAVQGIGGLGHLGVQFAHHMGFRTVAVSGSADKADLATELGADEYVDASAEDPAEALTKMGGARVILATAPDSKTITKIVDGLGPNGVLLVVGVSEDPIEVAPLQLIGKRASILGWPSGDARDSEETLKFAALRGIESKVETFPLTEAPAAYGRMMSNEVRFRAVLRPD